MLVVRNLDYRFHSILRPPNISISHSTIRETCILFTNLLIITHILWKIVGIEKNRETCSKFTFKKLPAF